MKATRIQNESKTLIDQILSSCKSSSIFSETLISDISDHFFTFLCPNVASGKRKEKSASVRSFTPENQNMFKTALSGTDWTAVLECNDVDVAYNEFWSTYSDLFELSFPKKTIKFNKNFHRLCPF
jgi:hypothetical protein